MSARRNILANYFGTGISAIVPIMALPWYLSLLGPKYWGLASFVWLLQALLGLVNAGLAQALIREISKLTLDIESGHKRIAAILFGFEKIYWAFAVVSGILLAYFAKTIVTVWLNLDDIPVETGRFVVYAAAFIFAVQFPVSIYRSVLLGCGCQVQQNLLVSTATIIRHIGCVFILHYRNEIEVYLIWNALIAFLETAVTAGVTWRGLGVMRSRLQLDYVQIKKVFLSSIGLSLSAIIGALSLQVDKVVLSWSVSVKELGYYATASVVAIGMLQIFTPIIVAMLPRLVQIRNQSGEKRKLNLKLLATMIAIVVSIGIAYALAGRALLLLWLRDVEIVSIVFPILSLLLIGTGMNAIYIVGYMNWVAAGLSKKVLIVNLVALSLSILLLPLLIEKYQLLGAAFSWLIINCVGMLLSLDWLIKRKEPSFSTR